MAVDSTALALQNKPALEAMGYTVEPDGKVSQGSVVGKQYVPPSTWMLQIPGSGFTDPKTGGINSNFDWSGVDSTEPAKGFAVSGEYDPTTGNTNNSINWANLLVTGAVGATGTAAALPFMLGGGGSAAAGGDAGANGGFFAAADGVGPMASGETGMAATTAALTPPAALSTGTGSSMGFLDTLSNLTKDASNVKNLISPSGAVGQQAGSIEQQRMNALIAEAKLQQQQDENQIAKNKAVLAAPGAMAQNSVRGDVLANAQDATVSGLPSYIHVPTIGGGLRPSLFSAATRNLGSQMSTQANQQMTSGKFTDPTLTPLPQASAYDKVLSGTAQIGGFLNATSGLIPKPGASTTTPSDGASTNPGDQSGYLPVGPVEQPDQSVGIDPAVLAYFQQQANGGGQ